MSDFVVTVTDRAKGMPDCCGNCHFNAWTEDGCHCRNIENWEQEEDLPIFFDDEGDLIEWSSHCENHKRGQPTYEGPEVKV